MVQRQKAKIKIYQINLQHLRAATNNLMQIINTGNVDIALTQEPYYYQNRKNELQVATEHKPMEKRKAEQQLSYQMTY